MLLRLCISISTAARWRMQLLNPQAISTSSSSMNRYMESATNFQEISVALVSPNQALQRAAIGIRRSAAGDLAWRSPQRLRARVLMRRRAVAELSS